MLSFETLRKANRLRLPQFKNSKGQLAHSKADGSDWTPSQWLQAVVGELGEFANIRKKFERGDLTFAQYKVEARKELADVQTYLDILAMRALDAVGYHPDATGIELGEAVREKFNEVSKRVGSNVEIVANDVRVTAPLDPLPKAPLPQWNAQPSHVKPESVSFPPQPGEARVTSPTPLDEALNNFLSAPLPIQIPGAGKLWKTGDLVTINGRLHRIGQNGYAFRVSKTEKDFIQRRQERENAMGTLRNGISVPLKIHHLRLGEFCFLTDRNGRTDYRIIFRITNVRAGENGRAIYHLSAVNLGQIAVECDAKHSLKVRYVSALDLAEKKVFDAPVKDTFNIRFIDIGELYRSGPHGR
jgi:NTP pyrophosphatase (non-canonical NTP hydrolase)